VTARTERFLPSGNEAGTAPEDRSFRPDVEGLRAIAVLLVVGLHAGFLSIGGAVGVDVFFVISGFVITGILLRERTVTGRVGLLAFYGRRARRILPAAMLVIVVTLIAERIIVGGPLVGAITGDARWALSFLADYPRKGNLVVRPAPLGVYWSLAIEEQFYVVYPALFLAVAMFGRRWSLRARIGAFLIVVVVASFSWAVISSPGSLYAYVSPLTRAWELAVGGLLAVGAASLRKLPIGVATAMTWIGLVGLLVIGRTLTIPKSSGLPGWIVALPVLATALIIGGGTRAPRHGAEMLLKLPPFKWLGRWSYSIYLWHYPILVIAAQRWGNLTTLETLALCVGAVMLSAATYFAVENPIRHSKTLTRSPLASIAMGCSLVAICLVVTFVI
jgi:peptidoglycan/LPS O-acetylase OafA/YrhL